AGCGLCDDRGSAGQEEDCYQKPGAPITGHVGLQSGCEMNAIYLRARLQSRRSQMRLKKLYSSREVAQLTGLTARQLQWWAQRNLFLPSVPSQKTDAGGFTERRYTPIELLELMVLADLRRKGFTVARIRKLLEELHTRFHT